MRTWLCADMTHHSACLEINVTYLISVKKYYSRQSLFTSPRTTLGCGKGGRDASQRFQLPASARVGKKKEANLLNLNVVVLTLLLVFSFCSPNHELEKCNVNEDPQPALRNDNFGCLTSNISQAPTQLTKKNLLSPAFKLHF